LHFCFQLFLKPNKPFRKPKNKPAKPKPENVCENQVLSGLSGLKKKLKKKCKKVEKKLEWGFWTRFSGFVWFEIEGLFTKITTNVKEKDKSKEKLKNILTKTRKPCLKTRFQNF
jgi:hypothetical protein